MHATNNKVGTVPTTAAILNTAIHVVPVRRRRPRANEFSEQQTLTQSKWGGAVVAAVINIHNLSLCCNKNTFYIIETIHNCWYLGRPACPADQPRCE